MKQIISTILDEWDAKKLPEVIERDIFLEKDVGRKEITVITGFRRTGKTYLLFGLISRLSKDKIVYVNFEDERIPLKTEFLTELISELKKDRVINILFLDEIQNIPGWSKWLRRIHDNENIKLFVTGSSSRLSSKEIPTELRGRFIEKRLYPLSFREFLRFKRINHNKMALREYIEFGGLPAVVLAQEENQKIELLHNYFNTVIRRDIIERFKIKNEEGLKALLNLILNSTSYSISRTYNTLKSLQFEIGKSTTQNYLDYIENSYFLFSVPLFSFKIKDQLQYPRKIYFIDTGFIANLSSKFSRNIGRLYENIVFLELKRRQSAKQEIFYWKNYLHEEVDFIVKEGNKIKQIIQVCYDIEDYAARKREVKSLFKAGKELKCSNLLIITENKEGKEKKIKYVPLWKWLLVNSS